MHIWTDLRVGARRLLADRGFTTAAVVTLALGIAATSTMFTIVNAILLRPMPFDNPDRIVEFEEVSYLDLQDLRSTLRTFESVAALDERSMAIADPGLATERHLGAFMSANGFSLIGVRPILGRDFRPEDDRPGASPVIILGHELWRTRYGLDPSVVNRTIRVNGVPSTVIGVMPEGFGFPMNAAAWQPLSMLPADVRDRRDAQSLSGLGRLRPGATRAQAALDLQETFERLDGVYPEVARRPRPVKTFRGGVGPDTPAGTMFLVLFGAVVFVLLIACANVANLLLVRAAARSREVSVRLSLGAGRWRIVRQLLVETALLATVASAIGFGLSLVALRLLWGAILASGEPPYWLTFALDLRVFAVLAATCVTTALLTGLAPAWVTARGNLIDVLADAGRGPVGNRRSRRWTGAFVISQLSLALVLLTGAGLMVRSVLALTNADAGVDVSSLIAARLDLGSARYSDEQRLALFRELEDRFASLPGVTAAFTSDVPRAGAPERQLQIEGRDDIAPEDRPLVGRMTIGANYFGTIGARATRGRTFRRSDADANAIAIVNERLAEMYFGGTDPIGRRVRLLTPGASPRNTRAGEAPWLTIVGVAPDVRQRSTQGGSFDPLVYVPLDANPLTSPTIVARATVPLTTAAEQLRAQVAAIDPDLPLFNIRTVEEELALEGWGQRFTGSLLAIVAGVALLLATIGIYAIAAYSASQRVREIGVRLALGALPRHIWWLVTRGAGAQLAAGLTIGSVGAIAMSRVLPSDVTGPGGASLTPLVAVAALLTTVAAIALALPARRALRLNPATVLRAE